MAILDSLGSTTFSLLMKVGLGLVIVVILGILYFASRMGFSWYKKRKTFKINACIIHPDGSFTIRQIGKFKGRDGIDKMEFLGSSETMPVIPPKYIRSNTVMLWRYDVGQYAVIPPKVWIKMNPKDFKIEVVDMQMKNFVFLEQRAAVSRWAFVKELMQKYAPFITIIILSICAGVIAWFMLKFGLNIFEDVTQQRTADCLKILGSGVSPPV